MFHWGVRTPRRRWRTRETIIAAIKPASWAYAENFHPDDEITTRARSAADEVGVSPIGAGGAATLRLLATAIGARAVVEVGTGTGVSGLALLAGMGDEGILTSVDVDPEGQRHARAAFTEAGVRPQRFRLIAGRAGDVLPRMTDEHYDLVLIDADKAGYDGYVTEGLRLLRPGGLLVIDNALWGGKVADANQSDTETTTIRAVGERIRDDETLVSALLPVGDGMLVAVKRS